MPDPQTALFLSPHFDDIALSCGGMAARLAKMGARCIGVTIFAAPHREGDTLSDFADGQHAMWESGTGQAVPAINEVRREEERQALRLLGLHPIWLDFQDAPYRRGSGGEHLYISDEQLFGTLAPEERRVLVPHIAEEIRRVAEESGARGRVRVFAPLSVGNHVDHQLVFQAARRLGPRYGVLFYEDYPYAAKPGQLATRLQSLGVRADAAQSPKSRVQRAQFRVISISDLIGVKIAAIARYKTQLDVLFGSSDAMPSAVRAYSQMVAGGDEDGQYAERFWQLPSIWTLS